ncbi:hypothetical protein [Caballeronia sp. LZ043]|uniref:hypothetical protein n=1 Tax=Caballeronia sp. LZ043 TaxID=3038569 RepID=UPI002855E17C|nr:hypothetical protein [Caballeronia sp. LZ043]MDR5826013.1 hypothetical protein [Caballeronia sp. LZ043]
MALVSLESAVTVAAEPSGDAVGKKVGEIFHDLVHYVGIKLDRAYRVENATAISLCIERAGLAVAPGELGPSIARENDKSGIAAGIMGHLNFSRGWAFRPLPCFSSF